MSAKEGYWQLDEATGICTGERGHVVLNGRTTQEGKTTQFTAYDTYS